MVNMVLNEIIDVIKSRKILLYYLMFQLTEDALGSGLALALALSRLNKNVVVYLEENIPQIYSFHPAGEWLKFS